MLSDIDGNIFDTLSFGPQGMDVSLGRCPDGSGEIASLPYTTFNSTNCESGIIDFSSRQGGLVAYPNPANTSIHVISSLPHQEKNIMIINILGEKFYNGLLRSEILICTSKWPSGVYAVVSDNQTIIKIIVDH